MPPVLTTARAYIKRLSSYRRSPSDFPPPSIMTTSQNYARYISPSYWSALVFNFFYVLVQHVIIWLFKPVSAHISTSSQFAKSVYSRRLLLRNAPGIQRAGLR